MYWCHSTLNNSGDERRGWGWWRCCLARWNTKNQNIRIYFSTFIFSSFSFQFHILPRFFSVHSILFVFPVIFPPLLHLVFSCLFFPPSSNSISSHFTFFQLFFLYSFSSSSSISSFIFFLLPSLSSYHHSCQAFLLFLYFFFFTFFLGSALFNTFLRFGSYCGSFSLFFFEC